MAFSMRTRMNRWSAGIIGAGGNCSPMSWTTSTDEISIIKSIDKGLKIRRKCVIVCLRPYCFRASLEFVLFTRFQHMYTIIVVPIYVPSFTPHVNGIHTGESKCTASARTRWRGEIGTPECKSVLKDYHSRRSTSRCNAGTPQDRRRSVAWVYNKRSTVRSPREPERL